MRYTLCGFLVLCAGTTVAVLSPITALMIYGLVVIGLLSWLIGVFIRSVVER